MSTIRRQENRPLSFNVFDPRHLWKLGSRPQPLIFDRAEPLFVFAHLRGEQHISAVFCFFANSGKNRNLVL